jgi:hypothetical protein
LDLGESKSPTQIFQRNLLLASHGLWAYVCPFRPELMVMMTMVIVTALRSTKVLGNNEREFLAVWKELCYGKAETWRDAEKVVSRWRDNLVR